MPAEPVSSSHWTEPTFVSSPSFPAEPFNRANADVTLRTSDGVDFRVFSSILSEASPVFSDMFSLPQPQSTGAILASNSGCVVVDVPEDSKTLDMLLRLCYPILKPELKELDDIVPVLHAATKYEMAWPIELLTRDLIAIIPQRPLRVWAIACRCTLEDLAGIAAAEILGRSVPKISVRGNSTDSSKGRLDVLEEMLLLESDVLDGICAGDYFRLREYLRVRNALPCSAFLSPSLDAIIAQSVQVQPVLVAHQVPHSPSPDLILLSTDSDDVQFEAHQLILSVHSSALGQLIVDARRVAAIRQTGLSDEAGCSLSPPPSLPVVQLEMSSQTLRHVLELLYHGVSHLPTSPCLLADIFVASETYGMHQLHTMAAEHWKHVVQTSSLEAYFVALQRGLNTWAKVAAKKVLDGPLTGSYVSVMESSSALAYHQLLKYHATIMRAVSKAIKKASKDMRLGAIKVNHRSSWATASDEYPDSDDYVHVTARRVLSEGLSAYLDLASPAILRRTSTIWPTTGESRERYRFVTKLLDFQSALSTVVEIVIEKASQLG